MGTWTGSWLSGPTSGRGQAGQGAYAGERLGLPRTGPGSVAAFGPRLAAFLVDSVIANLLVGLVYFAGVRPDTGLRGQLVLAGFLLQELILVATAGGTFGMRLLGLRVAQVARAGRVVSGSPPGVVSVAVRTALLALLVPALISDADGRGMHDRASGTVVVRV